MQCLLIQQAKLSDERQAAALAAFAAADAQQTGKLSQEAVRSALQTLFRLDDALFERFVGSRWASVASDAGVTSNGFFVLYAIALAPATKFGSALRKAAGRGDGKLMILNRTVRKYVYVVAPYTAYVCQKYQAYEVYVLCHYLLFLQLPL
jgi:hypothetical protein